MLKRVLGRVNLIGRWQWQAPAWLAWLGGRTARGWRYLAADRSRLAIALVLVIASAGGYAWYATRPTPHYVSYVVSAPGLTEYNDTGISSIKPLKIVFSESAAPLKQLQKAVTTGIEVSPAIDGSWFWTNDRELLFTPRNDWPVDGAFGVRFAVKGLLAPQVELDTYGFKFRSQPFSAAISDSQFYQDPRTPTLKKLVATVKFSHPVDTDQLESHVSLAVAKDAEYLGLTPDSRHFTVTYDKFRLAAFIHSAALPMPRDDTPMTLAVDKGVRAARGGNATASRLSSVVTIPGRTSLRFAEAHMTVVDNAKYEPEQILLLNSSSPVVERAFTGKVSVRLLPARHPKQPKEDKRLYDWSDQAEIGNDILAQAEPVTVSYVPSEEGGNTSHGFKFLAPVGRYLHVTVNDGVEGTGGYLSGKSFVATVRVGPYRRALTFLGQGALLSLSSDRKVGYLVRDIPGKSPIRVSQLHRAVALDPRTGRPDCPPYTSGTHFEVFEFWSSDMLKLFRQAGMPRRTPPPLPACASDDSAEGPRIASPLRSVSYALRRSAPQDAITLDASAAADVQRVFWFDGNALIGMRRVRDGALSWRPAAPGAHLIRIVDDHGRSAERDVDVSFTTP
jgi:hypothetical protein